MVTKGVDPFLANIQYHDYVMESRKCPALSDFTAVDFFFLCISPGTSSE